MKGSQLSNGARVMVRSKLAVNWLIALIIVYCDLVQSWTLLQPYISCFTLGNC